MTLIKQDPFDEGRVRFYSNTGYFIHDEDNDVKYYGAAVLKELENDFNFVETDEKIPANTYGGFTVYFTTPSPNYNILLQAPSESETTVNYGDGITETVTCDEINHTYTLEETYYLNIENNTVPEYYFENYNNEIIRIILGHEITSIGEYAFVDSKATVIEAYPTEPPVFDVDCFSGVTATMIVPDGCSNAYEEALTDCGGEITITERN